MSTNRSFRKLNELVIALTEAERSLAEGKLGLEGLEGACGNARELYERLVVLRHKARESALSGTLRSSVAEPAPKPAGPAKPPAEKAAGEEMPALRLDTRPPEIGPRQVSLIEAIEETQAPAPDTKKVAAKAPDPKPAAARTSSPTLAEKLEKAPVTDLSKAIALSHKFWFVAELFNGDRIAYEKTITLLNNMEARDEATQYMQQEVLSKLKKPADPEAISTFMDLLQRRFA
jgi:hypothetical protein